MPTNLTSDSVSVGPFEREPVGLGRVLSENFSESVSGEEIRRRCVGWLTDRLVGAGVALGAADREMVELLAEEGWSVAQVVGGWVSRAGTGAGADPLYPAAVQFPLGRPFDEVDVCADPPPAGQQRPFGLRFVQDRPTAVIDRSAIRYDPDRQIGVVDGPEGAVPLARHTDGTTNTATSDGHKSMDADTDHRED